MTSKEDPDYPIRRGGHVTQAAPIRPRPRAGLSGPKVGGVNSALQSLPPTRSSQGLRALLGTLSLLERLDH